MAVEATSMQATASPMTPGPREMRPRPVARHRPARARLALAHGAYLFGAGVWAFLRHRRKGAAVCLANLGLALAAAGARGKVAQELRLVAGTTALSLAAMDFRAAGTRRGSPRVRLFDAGAQLCFAALWAIAEVRERNAVRRPPEAAFA